MGAQSAPGGPHRGAETREVYRRDLRVVLSSFQEAVSELVRIDPQVQQSGWDTNTEVMAAIRRLAVAAGIEIGGPLWFDGSSSNEGGGSVGT